MTSRLSAAYKGVHVLLMQTGAQDFRSGQPFDHLAYFGESVDIQPWARPLIVARPRSPKR